jgi:single-strand DNA-binding protein
LRTIDGKAAEVLKRGVRKKRRQHFGRDADNVTDGEALRETRREGASLMAASLNKVMLIGNLGADPELRYTPSNMPVATLRVATNESWTDRQTGEKKEQTEWHRVIVWGKQAEMCEKYLSKGRSVYVEGQIQTREWEDRDGNKRWTTEIRAQRVQFLSGGGGGGDVRAHDPPPPSDADQPAFDQGFSDDEIPF